MAAPTHRDGGVGVHDGGHRPVPPGVLMKRVLCKHNEQRTNIGQLGPSAMGPTTDGLDDDKDNASAGTGTTNKAQNVCKKPRRPLRTPAPARNMRQLDVPNADDETEGPVPVPTPWDEDVWWNNNFTLLKRTLPNILGLNKLDSVSPVPSSSSSAAASSSPAAAPAAAPVLMHGVDAGEESLGAFLRSLGLQGYESLLAKEGILLNDLRSLDDVLSRHAPHRMHIG